MKEPDLQKVGERTATTVASPQLMPSKQVVISHIIKLQTNTKHENIENDEQSSEIFM